MLFVTGTPVYSADQRKLGRVSRFVIDPTNEHITHLVIRQGILRTVERVVPISLVEKALSQRIMLHDRVAETQDLPKFEVTVHIPTEFTSYSGAASPTAIGRLDSREPRTIKRIRRNVPEDHLVLNGTAKVISVDQQKVGQLNGLDVQSGTKQVTHVVVIQQGLLTKSYTRLPIYQCQFAGDNELLLTMNAHTFKAMPEFVLRDVENARTQRIKTPV